MPNIELLEKTLAHIEADVEAWNQGSWRSIPGMDESDPHLLPTPCGTAMCFAGEAIQLDNPKHWVIQPGEIQQAIDKWKNNKYSGELDNVYYALDWVKAEPNEPGGHKAKHPVTKEFIWWKPASTKGREVLGLDEFSANQLFNEANSLEDLQSAVAWLKEHDTLDGWEAPSYTEDEFIDA